METLKCLWLLYISLHSKTHTPENVSFLLRLSIMILTFLITPLECGVTNPAVSDIVSLSRPLPYAWQSQAPYIFD